MIQEKVICFLRGVNVGGKNRVKMSELAPVIEAALPGACVKTYIQSGNIIIDFGGKKATWTTTELERKVTQAIHDDLGLRVEVMARVFGDLTRELKRNPFKKEIASHSSRVFLGCLKYPPSRTVINKLEVKAKKNAEFLVLDQSIFLYCRDGMGKARLPDFEKTLESPVTFRNLKVIVELIEKFV